MIDKTDKQIIEERNRAIDIIKAKYPGEEIEVLDSFIEEDPVVENSREIPLWYLGKSIQILGKADYVYFCKDWNKYRGCRTEYFVANQYKYKNNVDENI